MSIRRECYNILKAADEDNTFVSEVLGNALRRMQFSDKRDRAFLTKLTEGVVERRISLDYLIDKFSKKAPDADTRIILRMGIYQIRYMEAIPARAAISESVELCKEVGLEGRSGYVNALLRKVAELKEEKKLDSLLVSRMETRYSTPQWLCDFLVKTYGKDIAKQILEDQYADHDTVIRVNFMKISPDELKEKLTAKGINVQSGILTDRSLRINGYDSVRRIPGYKDGLFTVQDETSTFTITRAGIKPGDKVLDLCAAPGGKSLLAYELATDTEKAGTIVSRDISERKIDKIKENIERVGIPYRDSDNGQGKYQPGINLEIADATVLDEHFASFPDSEKFDVVLADVPCSGLGIIGRKNDIKYHMTPESMKELATQGLKILRNASHYVNQTGHLIFSTCTINPEENERVVEAFLAEQESKTSDNNLFELVESRTFLQGIDGSDGFFYAVLKRK